MDSNDVASLDAQQKMGPKDYALMLHTRQLPPSPTLTRFTGQSAVRLIGRCDFSKYQVQYLLFNLAYPKGINTIREMVLVMRHKWPKQFKSLLESDLELLIQWLYPNPPALQ